MFVNNLVNAAHAIADTGDIYITTRREGDDVVIEISDTGKGISAESLKKIFDTGFTTKGTGVGTGLGLSIVDQIIQDHQGSIEVESKLGKGSIFRITLPVGSPSGKIRNDK